MPLTSLRLLGLCIAIAVSAPIVLLVLWRRMPRSSRWAIPMLLVWVLIGQVAAVAAVAVNLNRDFGFYPSWSSLFGSDLTPPDVTQGVRVGMSSQEVRRRVPPSPESSSGVGHFKRVELKGARSGITQTVIAWLPPQYNHRGYARTRFPVVMVLGGSGAHVEFVVKRLEFAAMASEEIRTGRVAPFVAVFPEINVALPMDTECVDYPGGPKAFTWLAQDVTRWATSKLRVSSEGRRWSVMGWSTGGYCAAMLHIREPARFGAGASIEGYFTPETDSTTGNLSQLLKQNQALAHETSALWLLENRARRSTHLLVMTSDKDPQSRQRSLDFLRREQNVPGIQPYVVHGLGHSMNAYKAVLRPTLRWLAEVADA